MTPITQLYWIRVVLGVICRSIKCELAVIPTA